MAAELVTLRHHMAHLTSPTPLPNGLPPRRPSPNGMGAAARMSPDPADLLPAAISGSLGMKVRFPEGVVLDLWGEKRKLGSPNELLSKYALGCCLFLQSGLM